MREPGVLGRLLKGRGTNRNWLRVVFVLAILLAPRGAGAEDDSAQIWSWLRLDLGTWVTTGDGEWTIDFEAPALEGEGAAVIGGRSTLEFEHLTNPLITARAEVQPRHWFALDAAVSFGASLSGRATDTDLGRLSNGDLILAIVSKSQLEGDTTIFRTNAYLRVVPFVQESENFVDVFAGYVFYRDSLDITDGVQVFSIDEPETSAPIPGLNSQYDFAWKGLRVGGRGELATPWGFKLRARAALIPWTTFEGKGFWNLRNLHFTQEAEGGIGVDALLSFRFRLRRFIGVELGFEYLRLHVENGEDIKNFPNGEVLLSELKEVVSSRYGPFILVNVGF